MRDTSTNYLTIAEMCINQRGITSTFSWSCHTHQFGTIPPEQMNLKIQKCFLNLHGFSLSRKILKKMYRSLFSMTVFPWFSSYFLFLHKVFSLLWPFDKNLSLFVLILCSGFQLSDLWKKIWIEVKLGLLKIDLLFWFIFCRAPRSCPWAFRVQ